MGRRAGPPPGGADRLRPRPARRLREPRRADQRAALEAFAASEAGTLHAVPGFGKTVTAAALIAQWRASLVRFLDCPPKAVGRIGARAGIG